MSNSVTLININNSVTRINKRKQIIIDHRVLPYIKRYFHYSSKNFIKNGLNKYYTLQFRVIHINFNHRQLQLMIK